MKFKASYLVWVVIFLLHGLFYVRCLGTAPGDGEGEKKAVVEEKSTTVDDGKTADGTPESSEGGTPSRSDALPPFSPQFFMRDDRALPAELAAQAASLPGCAVVDLDRRRVLYAKNEMVARPIASLTKMMTAYLVVKKIHASGGKLGLDTRIRVTSAASRVKERRVWLSPTETFTVEEMLKACLVHSANDCAYLLAEYFGGGSEPAFVAEMNREAASLGCQTLKYHNANGLPSASGDNQGAPLELAYLAMHLMKYPEIMRWTGVKIEYLRENDEAFVKRNKGATMLTSSNRLLGKCRGVNGMKTGYTNRAGHCIVATCEREGRRVAVVILGGEKRSRDKIAASLIEWYYSLKG